MRELRSHGFGHWTANASNDYILQYVMRYQPRNQKDGGHFVNSLAGRASDGPRNSPLARPANESAQK